jgi:uncharacterized protein
MASHPIGSEEELLRIETDRLTVTIKGKAEHPSTPGVVYDKPAASFRCEAKGQSKGLKVYFRGEEIPGDGTLSLDVTLLPVFFEQQNYTICIEAEDEKTEVGFWHLNQYIRNALSHPSSHHLNILFGRLNFENDIGLSDFSVLLNGAEYLDFTLEVFPCKIDYLSDYKSLMADVSSEVYSLLFDFLKRTYSDFDVGNETVTSPVEFIAILDHFYREYVQAADLILSQPHHQLIKEYRQVPSYKVRSLDHRCEKWLVQHPDHLLLNGNEIAADRCLTVKKRVSMDTRENRMTKYILSSTMKQIESFLDNYQQLDREEDVEISSRILRMSDGIKRRLNSAVLSEVPIEAERVELSSVFAMAPGYRKLFRYYLMLKRGLSLSAKGLGMSVKDVAKLYEYWCFIKLNHLLRKKYHCKSSDFIKVDDRGISVTLATDESQVVYTNPAEPGSLITLSYNKSYSAKRNKTLPQKPDNVLSLTKKTPYEGETDFNYVFDAKYKIDPADGDQYGKAHDNLPGPQEEDINTMHRYRDAILAGRQEDGEYRHTMFGAYVLFPYANETQYRQHDFYRSIETVNIGGLPFLPGHTKLVEKMLDSLIEESPKSAFARTLLPQGIENRLKNIDWTIRDVLVGSLRDKPQLDVTLQSRHYWILKSQVPEGAFPIRYVALYQSKNLFGKDAGVLYFGEVVAVDSRKRDKIPYFPGDFWKQDQDYWYFTIKEWQKLDVRIMPKELWRSVIFTNLFLLKNSEYFPELKIANEEEYRLNYELKWHLRMGVADDSNPSQLSFDCGNAKMFVEQDVIKLVDGAGMVLLSKPVALFRSKPEETVRDFLNRLSIFSEGSKDAVE